MIFFRKKKPEAPPPKPAKPEKGAPAPVKPEKKPQPVASPEPKAMKSLQEIAHNRVLTAEGWRRVMLKKFPKKAK